jgi:hypothetical protein
MAEPTPYFTTRTSDFYHSTTDCSAWKSGRNAGDGSNPVLHLTTVEAAASGKPGCDKCTPTTPAPGEDLGMTETTGDAPAPRRQHPYIPLASAVGFALIFGVATGAGGYMLGQDHGGTAGSSTTSSCDAVRAAFNSQNATANATPGNQVVLRATAHLVVDNPTCFDPQVLAVSQAYLDRPVQDG